MSSENADRNPKAWTAALVLLIIAAGVAIFFLRPRPLVPPAEPPEKNVQPPAPTARAPISQKPVIDYGRLDKDPAMRALMDERKADYGLKDSVDIIIRPDETMKIGDTVVSMEEILETIQMKEGEIIEHELSGTDRKERLETTRRQALEKLRPEVRRYLDIEKQLEDPAVQADSEAKAELIRQRDELKPRIEALRELGKIDEMIDVQRQRLQEGGEAERRKAAETIRDLIQRREGLEKSLGIPPRDGGRRDGYGIYVVQPGDNIWNIHFTFLKEYFNQRNLPLSPRSDEPDPHGYSSGVGKLLKFSEKMVYIYNVRERRLSLDLNQISPLTKLVVYNMGRIFDLLDQIDAARLNRLQFDGDSIWVPAAS